MRIIRFCLIAAIFVFGLVILANAAEQVVYIADSVVEQDRDFIKLHGGSTWTLSSIPLAMATYDVLIVFRSIDSKNCSRRP